MAKKSIVYKNNTIDISYEVLNPKEKIDLVILHGWGSNKALMKKSFSPFLPSFRHIYIDLPGFGNSTAPMQLGSEDYARIVELLLIELNAKADVAMGHSFGGKVATLLEPELLVLLSSAGIALPKPLGVKTKIAVYKFFKLFGVTKLREYFVADDAKKLSKQMYETFKVVVNEDFRDTFASFKNSALLCWGREDTATPLEAGLEIAKLIKNSRFIEYEGDHYFFLSHAKEIASQIEQSYIKRETTDE